MINKFLTFSFLLFSIAVLGQSKIVGEELKLVFSEYFVDPSDNFPRTGKADAKFWATYGDGYYYMEHKINSYTAIMAKQPKTNPDFAIKCKLMLGPSNDINQSVGVLFAMTNGGKNALVFEFNRKKQFRVRDLQGNMISDSWVKSKFLKPAEIYQKIEIKCFNKYYEIYVNDKQVFTFTEERFEGGRYGVIIGPLSLAKLNYFNVYDLTIPGRPSTIPTKKLIDRIDSLEKQNESLRKELIEKKFKTKDQSFVEVVNTLEKKVESLNAENNNLKQLLNESENNISNITSGEIKSDNNLITITKERDELKIKLEEALQRIQKINGQNLLSDEDKKINMPTKNKNEKQIEEKIPEKKSLDNDKFIDSQENYFPAIDELKIPVKKSSVKL